MTVTPFWFPGRCRWSRRWRRWVGRGSGRSCRWVPGRGAGSSCGSPRRPMSGRWSRRRCPRPATRCSTAGTPEVTWADALAEVCTRSLGSVTARSRQESFRVYVHLDVEGGWLTGRPRLPGHLVAKLTCAGTVQPVWQRAGVPVSVGRALRIVPERTRRLVLDRDRGCRFPGCVARAHLEVHHVVHWVDGGRTDLANLAGLCPFHHDAHHRGEFSIGGDANTCGGLVFLARGGFPIGPGPIYAPTAPRPGRHRRRGRRPGRRCGRSVSRPSARTVWTRPTS